MKTKRLKLSEDEVYSIYDVPQIIFQLIGERLTVHDVRHHIYQSGMLVPSGRFGNSLTFKVEDVRAFLKRRRPAHRPPQKAVK